MKEKTISELTEQLEQMVVGPNCSVNDILDVYYKLIDAKKQQDTCSTTELHW